MKKVLAAWAAALVPCSAYALPMANPWEAGLMRTGIFCPGVCQVLGQEEPKAETSDKKDDSSDDKDDDKNGNGNGNGNGQNGCNSTPKKVDPPPPRPPSFCCVWSWRFGYYGDYVFNRHMDVDRDLDNSNLHQVKISTNAAYGALNFWNRFDLFGTLGVSHISLETPGKIFRPTAVVNNQWVRSDSETHYAWSFGVRGTIWECGCLALGAEVQYAHSRPHVKYFTVEGFDPFYFNHTYFNYREWQLGLGAAYSICFSPCTRFVPFVGIRWSHAKIKTRSPQFMVTPAFGYTLFNLESARHIGGSVGFTLVGCSKVSITVEGRFIDEKALSINSQVRF